MVKKVAGHAKVPPEVPSKHMPKIALQLERIKTKVSKLMDKIGTQILRAGKPPVATDQPPSKSKRLVAQAAETVFHPKKTKHK